MCMAYVVVALISAAIGMLSAAMGLFIMPLLCIAIGAIALFFILTYDETERKKHDDVSEGP